MRRWQGAAPRTVLLGIACLVAGCTAPDTNFSQFPGFDTYLEAHPPGSALPDDSERALLERFRPRLFVAVGQSAPVDFYRDYIRPGVLRTGAGQVLQPPISAGILNAHRDDPRAEFVHHTGAAGSGAAVAVPIAYGTVEHENLLFATDAGEVSVRLVLLTYHFVFRHSGLPFALPVWQAVPLGLIGDLSDWHQLDHYTAVTVLVDASQAPVAMVVQQHNYQRTYLFGETVSLGPDGRASVDVALRSNELYPHRPGRHRRRAVRFLTPAAMRFMLGDGPRPWTSADDVTQGDRELGYQLGFLPPDDAFYTFKGFLGERRRLPGRAGPPGALYNTLPELKPWSVQAFLGYWREGNSGDLDRFERTVEARRDYQAFAVAQSRVFLANWRCLSRGEHDCTLE